MSRDDDVEDEAPRRCGTRSPQCAGAVVERRGDDLEVLRAVRIGEDDEPAVMMIDRVVVLGARAPQPDAEAPIDRRRRLG